MDESVLFSKDQGVAFLILNEPKTRNAISSNMIDELVDKIQLINEDTSICCVVITGSGKGFCSGGNVKDMSRKKGQRSAPVETRLSYLHGIQRIPRAMYDLEPPCIAAINGAAAGAGLDLALMCDIRIAGESAIFAENFLRVGLIPGDGGAWLLPKAVGLSRAYEMAFTAEFIGSARAAAIGLVSEVTDDALLVERATALAKQIAGHPSHSLRLTKRLIRDAVHTSLPAALEAASSAQALVESTYDQREAIAAFTEKRAPKFRNK